MIILCWNVRGLGNIQTFEALENVLRLYKSNILFICETKCSVLQMERIKINLNFENCFAVNSSGFRGGLALFWHSDLDLRISSFSMYHIDCLIMTDRGIH